LLTGVREVVVMLNEDDVVATARWVRSRVRAHLNVLLRTTGVLRTLPLHLLFAVGLLSCQSTQSAKLEITLRWPDASGGPSKFCVRAGSLDADRPVACDRNDCAIAALRYGHPTRLIVTALRDETRDPCGAPAEWFWVHELPKLTPGESLTLSGVMSRVPSFEEQSSVAITALELSATHSTRSSALTLELRPAPEDQVVAAAITVEAGDAAVGQYLLSLAPPERLLGLCQMARYQDLCRDGNAANLPRATVFPNGLFHIPDISICPECLGPETQRTVRVTLLNEYGLGSLDNTSSSLVVNYDTLPPRVLDPIVVADAQAPGAKVNLQLRVHEPLRHCPDSLVASPNAVTTSLLTTDGPCIPLVGCCAYEALVNETASDGSVALFANLEDTAGNLTSQALIAELALDTTPPRLTHLDTNPEVRAGEMLAVTFEFNEPVVRAL
jgi:hypothetical protein